MKYLEIGGKSEMPILGFGTWRLFDAVCEDAVTTALEVGYRHIDTASIYGNHEHIAKVLKHSALPRNELFITSKLWFDEFHKQDALAACKRSLDELGLDYLDLFLLHWPNRVVPIGETVEAMELLKHEGLIREWGVSNFTSHHIEDILKLGFKPAVNQVELHPTFSQSDLRKFSSDNEIVITAYSPLGKGVALTLPKIMELAKKHERPASQVVLNWIIQSGMSAVPKATTREHIDANFKALEWELSPEEMKEIDNLNTNNRMQSPGFADFDY